MAFLFIFKVKTSGHGHDTQVSILNKIPEVFHGFDIPIVDRLLEVLLLQYNIITYSSSLL